MFCFFSACAALATVKLTLASMAMLNKAATLMCHWTQAANAAAVWDAFYASLAFDGSAEQDNQETVDDVNGALPLQAFDQSC